MGCGPHTYLYPERKDIIESVYASGKIIAENEYNLFALSNGTIARKLVRDGDTIKKDQVLYIIRNDAATARMEAAEKNYGIAGTNVSEHSPLLADLRLAYESALIRLKNDSLTYYRWKNLWDKNVGTRVNLDNVLSNYLISINQKKIAEQKYYSAQNEARQYYNNAKNLLESSKNDLKEHFISTSTDGIVYKTFKEAGEAVHSNEIVALIGADRSPLKLGKLDNQAIEENAMGKLRQMQLGDIAQKLSGKLSGGQQQRVAIARALINDPLIILADEPTGNLDSANTSIILEIFKQLSSRGNTIITVTHDKDFAGHADRIVQMIDGKIM